MNWGRMGRVATGELLLIGVAVAAPLFAQDPREGPVSRAFNEFDTNRRLQMLTPALDPSIGPLQGWWPMGVQLMAQTLIEEQKDQLAGIYLRWAVRLAPDLQADTVQFLPEVATAFRAAREFVGQTRGVSDSLAYTSWLWPAQRSADTTGQLQVTAPTVPSLRATAEGVGAIAPGSSTALLPGSYRVSAAAPGYDSLAVTREVLPGVTTILELRPRRTALAAGQEPAKPEIPPANTEVGERRKKKFPVALVLGGVAAAGAVVALAAGGGGDDGGTNPPPPPPPTTGSISFTFPNP